MAAAAAARKIRAPAGVNVTVACFLAVGANLCLSVWESSGSQPADASGWTP